MATAKGEPARPGWRASACILCEYNCGIEILLGADGRSFGKIRGDKRHPASQGYTCNKALQPDAYQNGRAGIRFRVLASRYAGHAAGGQVHQLGRSTAPGGDGMRFPVEAGARQQPDLSRAAQEGLAVGAAIAQIPHPQTIEPAPRTEVAAGHGDRSAVEFRTHTWCTGPSFLRGSPLAHPVARSHTRSVPSSLPLTATARPSRMAQSMLVTVSVCPMRLVIFAAPEPSRHTRTVRSYLFAVTATG